MAEWWETHFDEDYFQVYSISQEQTAAEVDFVIRTLELKPDDRVLDLACGHGRHSIEMAKRGLNVTGQDLSAIFLERARRDASEASVQVEFILSDMREIPFTGEFDAVVNLWTSFGYFERDEDNERVISAVTETLRPGGRFLIDVMSALRMAQVFRSKRWMRLDTDSPIILEDTTWDHMRGRLINERTMLQDGCCRRQDLSSIRCYVLPELRRMAEAAGMEAVAVYGDFAGAPYSHLSHRIILHTKKPES